MTWQSFVLEAIVGLVVGFIMAAIYLYEYAKRAQQNVDRAQKLLAQTKDINLRGRAYFTPRGDA